VRRGVVRRGEERRGEERSGEERSSEERRGEEFSLSSRGGLLAWKGEGVLFWIPVPACAGDKLCAGMMGGMGGGLFWVRMGGEVESDSP